MTHPLRSSTEQAVDVSVSRHDSEALAPAAALQARFIEQLALHSDGIGWVQTLECLRRRGVLDRVAKAGSLGIRLGELAEVSGANLGYLAVVFRVLAVQGWLWRDARRGAEHTHVGLNAAGRDLARCSALVKRAARSALSYLSPATWRLISRAPSTLPTTSRRCRPWPRRALAAGVYRSDTAAGSAWRRGGWGRR